jgi:flavin-dependent dehydrogenase
LIRCGLKGSSFLADRNVLAVGEAVGTTFPFTGEGIGKAMESGEIAAHVVHKALKTGDLESLNEYPRLLEEQLRPRYLGYEVASKWLSKAWLNDLVALRVSKSRFLHSAVTGILSEESDPRKVFSLQCILRSFWR